MTMAVIDDSSSAVVYSGQWVSGGVDQEHNHTSHGSWTKGSQATISFTGQSIFIYGTIGREHNNGDAAFAPISTYMIDGKNDSTTMFTAAPGNDTLYNQLFYQSPKLGNGQHQLVVTLTTTNMNTMWIDYLEVEKLPTVAPALIAGIVVGAAVGIALLVVIFILWRRLSSAKGRQVQYEKVPRKTTPKYWSWMSSHPAELVPFGNDPYSDTQPLNGTVRPFSSSNVHYTPYSESSQLSDTGTAFSSSGYTTRGDTSADKTANRSSTNTASTSRSGYTTRGGTYADKTVSSSTPTSSPTSATTNYSDASGRTSQSGYTIQGTTQAEKVNSPSRQINGTSTTSSISASANADGTTRLSPIRDSEDFRPRPFLTATMTRRMVDEGEEIPPAYLPDLRR